MKLRLDYVSNSSSSSFMIVGHAYETDELVKSALRIGFKPTTYDGKEIDINDENFDENEVDTWDVTEWLEDKYGLKSHFGIYEYDEDTCCIGLTWDDMKGDETKNQFIARIADTLEKVFGERPTINEMLDGGMDC